MVVKHMMLILLDKHTLMKESSGRSACIGAEAKALQDHIEAGFSYGTKHRLRSSPFSAPHVMVCRARSRGAGWPDEYKKHRSSGSASSTIGYKQHLFWSSICDIPAFLPLFGLLK